jgi:SagB-type dehydrogenase family enzyme
MSDLALVQHYHQRSKHALNAYAAGPETLDWDAQPNPFRRYEGAPLTPLPLAADTVATPWADLFEPGRVAARPLDLDSLGLLLELSFALAAWKQAGPDRWAVRINPSSGNLHPTEAWLLTQQVPGLADGVHHYTPHEHALEQRASAAAAPGHPPRAWFALSSIHWREAWKYGERAFRYALLDGGHAVGALRYAAALCGWRLQALPTDSATLAHLLGLDRDADFGLAERDDPELLFELRPATAAHAEGTAQALATWLQQATWHGRANRLDRHPMYRWPVIAEAAAASAPASATRFALSDAAADSTAALAPLPRSPRPAATLIRQRRSAQRFDARARMPLAQLWPLLQALHPARLPFDAAPGAPQVHVLLLAHRVDGLPPGAYLLPRGAHGAALLRACLPAARLSQPVPHAPADVPLLCLAENPALAGTLRTLNCHQALGSDAILGFALLAEFNPLANATAYRERFHEAGLIGQALYLEAEALGLRGTGIGCYFDDALHQLIGLAPTDATSAPLQSVYHFTIGLALDDARIGTAPPYAHLARATVPPPLPGAHHV